MKNFTYFRPATVEQAVGLLEPNYGNTELLGGGTDLHALQKNWIAQPSLRWTRKYRAVAIVCSPIAPPDAWDATH